MSNRWCIIARPRTGSTWLELMINKALPNNNKKILGEYIDPLVASTEKRYLKHGYIETEKGIYTVEDKHRLYLDRKEILSISDTVQSLTMRIFPQSTHYDKSVYIDFIGLLKTRNFKFIFLDRDLTDSVISFCAMLQTGVIQRFGDKHCVKTPDGNILLTKIYDNIEPFNINVDLFAESYSKFKINDQMTREILSESNIDYYTIRFNNLIDDCIQHGIPIGVTSNVYKTHTQSYDNLMLNLNEIHNLPIISRQDENKNNTNS
jgi:hypothetical protein